MTEARLRAAVGALALAGLGIAAYLTYARYSGAQIACATGGCETVQHSRYAVVAGVPVAVLGIVAYAGLLVTVLARGAAAAAVGFGLAAGGVVFSAYLLVAQLALIHAICQWCVASDGIVSVLAVAAWARYVVAHRRVAAFPTGIPQRQGRDPANGFSGGADGRRPAPPETSGKRRAARRPGRGKERKMLRKILEIGGVVAAAVLVAFGIASIVISMQGQNTVNSSLRQQQIYGTPDMSPKAIQPEVKAAQTQQAALFQKLDAAGVKFNGQTPVPATIAAPSCTAANQLIDDGTKARCFASYMWIHTMGTNPLTYSQMGRYEALSTAPFKATDGLGGTNLINYSKTDPKTLQPVDNARRDLWVTYTALTTALNTSYMASQISMFGIVVGVALLLSGFGFGILAIGGALRAPETALGSLLGRWAHKGPQAPAVPAA